MDFFKPHPRQLRLLGLMLLGFFLPGSERDAHLKAAVFTNAQDAFESELFIAIEKGDLKAVREFLDKQPRAVRSVEPFGITPLHVAARHGRLEILDLLVQRGAIVDYHRRGGDGPPLYEAVKNGQTAAVQRLLEHGADLRSRTRGGDESLLSVAVGAGHIEVVKLLLDRGADINGNSKQPWDWPLLKAVEHRKSEIVHLLIERGVDVNAVDKEGWGILGRVPHYCPPEIIDLLKGHIQKRDLLAAVRLGEEDTVKEILSKNDRTPKDWESQSFLLLQTAIKANHPRILELLLKARANVNQPSRGWDVQTPWNLLPDRLSPSVSDYAGIKRVLSEHGAMPISVLRPPLKAEPLAAGPSIEFAHFHYFPGGGVWVEERDLYWSIRNVDGRKYTEMEFDEDNITIHVVDDPGGASSITLTRYTDGKWTTEKLKDTAELKQQHPKLFEIYEKKNTRVGFHQAEPNAIKGNQFIGKWMSTGPGSSHVDPREEWMYSLRSLALDQIEIQLEQKPNLAQHADKDGVTPLHHAVDAGRLDVVKLLVESGADVNVHSKRYGAPLHYAVAARNAELVKWLLDHKADPSPVTDTRLTPLHQAAAFGDAIMVEHLLKAKAELDVQLREPSNVTALILAAEGGHLAIVKRLWEQDPKNARTDQQGDAALEEAIKHGQHEVAEWLAQQGAISDRFPSLNQLDGKKRADEDSVKLAVLRASAIYCLEGACELGRIEEVKRYLPYVFGLKEQGRQIRDRSYAPLHAAIRGNQSKIAQLLVAEGVPIYDRNSYGLRDSAWELAISKGNTEMAKVLLDHLADPDTHLSQDEERPWQSAVRFGRIDVLKLLSERGAKIPLTNESGTTALHYAASTGQVEVMKYLLELGASIDSHDRSGNTPLHSGAAHLAVVEELLQQGSKTGAKNLAGHRPIDLATWAGHTDSIKKLIEAGASVDIFTAVSLGDSKRIQEMIFQRGDILRDRKFAGRTPFLHAAAMGKGEIAAILLKQDVKQIADTCDGGKTALHYAAGYSRQTGRGEGSVQSLVSLLLEHGAEVNALDKRGRTPLDESWSPIRDLLEERGGKCGYELRKPQRLPR